MTHNFLEWFRAFYPLFITLISLAGLGTMAWLTTKFAAKADLNTANDTLAKHHVRLSVLEEHMKASPTRQELHDELSDLAERMGAVESGLKGISSQLSAQNKLIGTLIEKAIPQAKA